ncbi:hypothetical protein ACFP1Z_30930 [Streptomyces gamaensis]|uniref:Uncharacterized protein n=1 Tax=Streptomyces gamaensis TaxID=1763542 RepID=A0ABW0Z8W9_9ACTN
MARPPWAAAGPPVLSLPEHTMRLDAIPVAVLYATTAAAVAIHCLAWVAPIPTRKLKIEAGLWFIPALALLLVVGSLRGYSQQVTLALGTVGFLALGLTGLIHRKEVAEKSKSWRSAKDITETSMSKWAILTLVLLMGGGFAFLLLFFEDF